jgi:outer membrane protein TolC
MSARPIIDRIGGPARLAAPILLASLCMAGLANAQSSLSLAEAIARARAHNPDAGAAAAAAQEAAARLTQARSGYFPRVDVAESWQRGTDPVFVFSARLAQRRFTAADFAVDAINHPAAADNVRTALSVEHSLFDRATAAHVRAASIGRDMALTTARQVAQELTSSVTEAFGRVVMAAVAAGAAAATVEAARADRGVAANRRDAGRATDADVLQLDVYLARAREQHVQATADERIARARLNQLMGEALSAVVSLDLAVPAIALDGTDVDGLEAEALANRPEVTLARQEQQLAAAAMEGARAAFLPQVTVQGVWELNGRPGSSRSSSWMAGAAARINLFRGLADQARLAETRALAARRRQERAKAETMARLEVEVAIARLEAARAKEAVGRAAADQARENQRIVRNRYASGLTDAAALLRAADAVQQADVQQVSARVDVLTATATLNRALGRP